LEQFSYTVSHDLKAPLITVSGFLNYLEEDVRANDAESVKKDIEQINKAIKKMNRLLDEILELSRIGRMMHTPENIPFENIVREALELTGGRLNERNIEVRIGNPLPTVHGDRTRLVQAMQNLIDNAAK
jgi:signal transduction histidine kinase